MELGFYTYQRKSNPGSSRGSPLHFSCATPAPLSVFQNKYNYIVITVVFSIFFQYFLFCFSEMKVKMTQGMKLVSYLKIILVDYLFSHTQRVSVTLAIRLCPLLSLLLSPAWTFLVFRLLLFNRCTDLLQILCGCSLGGPLLRLLKSGSYPYFSWNYG